MGEIMEQAIANKEKAILNKVMGNYDLNVKSYEYSRSAYKVICEEGNFCLKRMKHGYHKAENGFYLVEELSKKGFTNLAAYYKTSKGAFYVKYKEYIFYLTEWIDGTECNLKDIEEAKCCVRMLGDFHNKASEINIKKLKLRNRVGSLDEFFKRNLRDMQKYKKIIFEKKLKTDFDNAYFSYIDLFYDRGLLALKELNSSSYFRISKDKNECKLCHDSFYYQNILKKDDIYYLIDLDSIILDLQIVDLAKLIRRLIQKKEYKYNFFYVKELIDAYREVKDLSKSDLEIMFCIIIFPHKFWKLGKKRYIKHKNWAEEKYAHKLRNLVIYYEEEKTFIQDYIEFLNSVE